ncbi:tigger transposable element-derived protein 6 [Dermacentor silvarum]|uniref:tigger transposable element-derived protein 6 n=1 Tax=Dermacentor silvarum TaxID=543639 RepID=UPI001898ABE2|nr:tigger transposable element-derived protein 6 [Dermacentor silvarum]
MGVAPSTVATILKDRQKILELHRGSQLAPSRKRLRLGNFQDVDAAVLTWFKDARSQNVPVSGPMLQEKARQFADALDITGFEPLNQGIIKSVKAHYRTRLVQRLLINLRMKLPTSINVLHATEMVIWAWWSVTSTTIQNCWRKAGLVSESEQGSEESGSESEQGSEESDVSGMWQEVVERLAMDASVTFEDYVQCDDEACTSAELTTDDIVSAVRGDNSDEDANGEDDAETAPVSQPEESLSNADIMECVRKMRTYLGRCSNATEAEHKNVDNFEAFVLRQLSGTRQAKITDFLK